MATKGVEARLVLQAMGNARNRLNVVILDACRNNPFAQSASRALVATGTDGRARSDSASGLAPMEALVGTLIAFATAPESVAADGSGKNGVYTENLLRNISEPGLRIEDVFKRTRFAVRQETSGRQVPWENTSLEGDFYFVAPVAGSTVASGSAGTVHHLRPRTAGVAADKSLRTPPRRSPRGARAVSPSRVRRRRIGPHASAKPTKFAPDCRHPVPTRYANDRLSSTLRRNRAPMDWSRRSAARASRSWSISTCSRPA